jgi:hypothetical protein
VKHGIQGSSSTALSKRNKPSVGILGGIHSPRAIICVGKLIEQTKLEAKGSRTTENKLLKDCAAILQATTIGLPDDNTNGKANGKTYRMLKALPHAQNLKVRASGARAKAAR